MNDRSVFTDAEFSVIAREVRARSGYALTPDLAPAVESRLTAVQRRNNLASMHELLGAARTDPKVWDTITDALVVSETRFFRDRGVFQALRSDLLPALFRRRGAARLNILSVGCASGQEPYSLAMLLEEMRAEGYAGGDITAIDYSERLLEKARTGLYSQFEVQRGLPIRKLMSNFEKVGELWKVSDRLRALIRFERRNVLHDAAFPAPFDLVLCCHVLGGFDTKSRSHALHNLAGALAPDGVLITAAEGVIDLAGDAYSTLGERAGIYQRNADWRRAA